jgi:hypothetical protein
MRYAHVKGARTSTEVEAYLPANYRLVSWDPIGRVALIEGEDRAGWTLEDYVIPRLASGLIFAVEVTL